MKLLLAQGVISAVYVFDVSAYPFVHVPLLVLTILYLGSILELYGLVRMAGYVRRRITTYRESARGRSTALETAFLALRLLRSSQKASLASPWQLKR